MITQVQDFQIPTLQLLFINANELAADAEILLNTEKEQYLALTNPKRKISFLGVRYLRNHLKIQEEIHYLDSGKPYLKGVQLHISISHTFNFVALAVCKEDIGVDIELKSRNCTAVMNKFISESEKNLYQSMTHNWPLEIWCAKEAVYKLYDLNGLSFLKEIEIIKRDNLKGMVMLEGVIKRNIPQHQFRVQLFMKDDLLIALAQFNATVL